MVTDRGRAGAWTAYSPLSLHLRLRLRLRSVFRGAPGDYRTGQVPSITISSSSCDRRR